MKITTSLLALALVSVSTLAAGDTSPARPLAEPSPIACADDTTDGPKIAHVSVSEGEGDLEIVDIRVTGKNANAFDGMTFEIQGARAQGPAMTKVAGSNGPNGNGTSLWSVEIDLDQYADAEGKVVADLKPSCCWIPGAIVVRSKGR